MNVYKTSSDVLTGESYNDLERKARTIHKQIASRTKRTPYVRSKYFNNSKVFVGLFWEHLSQKSQFDRRRRLRYYAAGIDLLRHTTIDPETRQNPNGNGEIVHRFMGETKNGEQFYVQVKENKRTNGKYFMSVFGVKKKPAK